MTNDEALKIIGDTEFLFHHDAGYAIAVYDALSKAEEALKKQTPKKPDFEGDGYADGEIVYDIWLCPVCGTEYEVEYDHYDYCPSCGQHICWEEGDVE